MEPRQPHPSGRPIRREKRVGRGYWNRPEQEPVTPRLRQPQRQEPMGFYPVHDLSARERKYYGE